MNTSIRNSNHDLGQIRERLEGIEMPPHERTEAEAEFARAEAFADGLIWIGNLASSLVEHFVRPIRWLATSRG